jgi:hypothetical protein
MNQNGTYQPSISVSELKTTIHKLLKDGKEVITIAFTDESVGPSGPQEPIPGPTIDPRPPSGKGGQPPVGVAPNECNVSSLDPGLSFDPGNPNVFSWNEQEGYTYHFELFCSKGDCDGAISISTSVTGGRKSVTASYDDVTEKKYTCILTVSCGSKSKKFQKKDIRLSCSN